MVVVAYIEALREPPDFSRMPSLFRFLFILGLIAGIAYVAVFSLANFVKHQPREIVVTVPADKFVKEPR